MKKIILIIILVIIGIPSNSYASWECLIKDKSAQVLLDYIKNNKAVLKNIAGAINNSTNTSDGNRKGLIVSALSKTEGVFNEVFNFPSFYSYYKYFSVFPILNEIPKEAKRDYKLLEDEVTWLMNYLKKVNSKWKWFDIVEEPCSWVDWFCDYEKGTVKDILWQLARNSDNILDLYRLTIMWEEHNVKLEKLRLVNDDFTEELKKHYSTEAINACNSIEGWFSDTVTKAIENIMSLTEQWEDGIQEWKDAWQLLIWNKTDEEAKIEKEALKEILKTKWINTDYQKIMTDILGNYELEWTSTNNSFMTNTFKVIKSNIAEELRPFKEETLQDTITIKDEESISIEEFKKLDRNSQKTKKIQEEITTLYEKELPFAAIWDISTEDLRARIIEAHASLDRSIRTLEKIIPKSQNVCNSQWGGWDCD